jgi:enoyl-CoA hydratase/carnithine racemase
MNNLVLREDKDGISILTLNRPEALNALSPSLFVELREQVDAIAKSEDSIGCMILQGAGRSFSAGNDLKALQKGEIAPSEHFQAETIDALEAMPQPVIAAVQGHCYTGALELVLGCDLLICSENAEFFDTHAKWGLSSTWGMSQRLPQRIGYLKAKELMYTSRLVSGKEAVEIGLANRCVPDNELKDAVMELAGAIVENSWFSLRTYKMLMREARGMKLSEALEFERKNSPGMGPDTIERLEKFFKSK